MKKLIILVAVLICSADLFAQSNKEDIAIIQAQFGKDKKQLVQEFMVVPDDKKDKFWKLYDEYEESRKKLGRDRIDLISQYADNYATLDDKKATDLMTKKMNWRDSYGKFQKNYFGKFSSVIGGLQASKLMQLEDYLENIIQLSIQDQIPFVGELDKTKLPEAKQN
jgi:hypothetical protein